MAIKAGGNTWLAAGVIVAAALAYVAARRLAGNAASAVTDLVDTVTDSAAAAWGATKEAAAAVAAPVIQTAQGLNQARPGYALPTGWYRVKRPWGEVVTRNPDSFYNRNAWMDTIDP